jgi:hypothetical protein
LINLEKYTDSRDLISTFIEKKLKRKLMNDQKEFKITSEGDLQSCVYYHIRKFIDKKKIVNWYVLNKLSMGKIKDSKKFPDIAIVRMKEQGEVTPIFLIELKEDKKFNPKRVKKDIKKLSDLVKKRKKLEQTFFIYAVLDDKLTQREIENEITKLKRDPTDGWLFPIAINMMGEKQFPKHSKNYMLKINKLRKLR